ncbi:MAG: leucine-rich repeat domain-containing protein [Bacteroidales bacterium]|nr:leucine-rich repeat domain-containing protein [Bacteroidales bacterium]
MYFKYLIFIFLATVFLSCENDTIKPDNQSNDNNVTTDTSAKIDNFTIDQKDSLSEYIILEIVKNLPFDYLPKPIQAYIDDSEDVSMKLFDYNSAGFIIDNNKNYTQAKIQYLKIHTNMDIVGVYFFEKSNFGFKNYFYFLQKQGSNWLNITQFIISNEILSNIEENLDANLSYSNINGIYAYSSDYTEKALLFDFSNNPKIYIFEKNTWSEVSEITFFEGVFNLVKNDNPTLSTKMLNQRELDNCIHFYSLNEALKDTQNVYIANFANIGLSFLSDQIAELKRLQILILDDNYLTKIPDKLTELQKLQIIRANNNSLENLPQNIGLLSNIEEISVSFNKISFIPNSITKASNLKILNIDHNLLSDININWGKLNKLVILNISNNNISILPASIGKIDDLISLDISNNPISNLPDDFFLLKKLAYIDVTNTNIPDNQIVKLMGLNAEITVVMD